MTVSDVLTAALGAVALGAALLVVTTRHVVRAGLWLVVATAQRRSQGTGAEDQSEEKACA